MAFDSRENRVWHDHIQKWSDKQKMSTTPEHDKRDIADGLHDDVDAAYRYVESVTHTADYPIARAWHGWALREAFLAGVSHAEKTRKGG